MKYQLLDGAKAYSLTGILWGNAQGDENEQVDIVDEIVAKGRKLQVVDAPRWWNGKRWGVEAIYLEEVDSGTPPDPQPVPGQPYNYLKGSWDGATWYDYDLRK